MDGDGTRHQAPAAARPTPPAAQSGPSRCPWPPPYRYFSRSPGKGNSSPTYALVCRFFDRFTDRLTGHRRMMAENLAAPPPARPSWCTWPHRRRPARAGAPPGPPPFYALAHAFGDGRERGSPWRRCPPQPGVLGCAAHAWRTRCRRCGRGVLVLVAAMAARMARAARAWVERVPGGRRWACLGWIAGAGRLSWCHGAAPLPRHPEITSKTIAKVTKFPDF